MAPLGAQGGVWGVRGPPKCPYADLGGRFGAQNDFKIVKNDPKMITTLPNMTPRYPQIPQTPKLPPGLPSGDLGLLGEHLRIRAQASNKPRGMSHEFSLPCGQSPSSSSSSSSSYAGKSATTCFTILLGLLREHRIRASKHPNGRGG